MAEFLLGFFGAMFIFVIGIVVYMAVTAIQALILQFGWNLVDENVLHLNRHIDFTQAFMVCFLLQIIGSFFKSTNSSGKD